MKIIKEINKLINKNKKAIRALKVLDKHCVSTLCEQCVFYDKYGCGLKNGNPVIYYDKYKNYGK